jgi:hypothetical protein
VGVIDLVGVGELVGVGDSVTVGRGVLVGVTVGTIPSVLYWIKSFGAFAELPLYDTATRCPVPVAKSTRELPLCQPFRLITSCTTFDKFGV